MPGLGIKSKLGFLVEDRGQAEMSCSGEVIKFMAPGYKMGECRDFK